MRWSSPVIRISLGLVAVTCSLLLTLDMIGLLPAHEGVLRTRIQLCEILAAQAIPAIERNDLESLRAALRVAVARSEEVLSTGLRRKDGRLLLIVGDHDELWEPDPDRRTSSTHVEVPLLRRGQRWGAIEVRFAAIGPDGALGAFWNRPLLRTLVLIGVSGFVAYLLYLRRTLRHLDPSAVIPARVQNALDVMAEGVLLVDENERIVLVNTAAAFQIGRSASSLMGVKVSELAWGVPKTSEPGREFPWVTAIRDCEKSTGMRLLLSASSGETRSFVVNGAPVLDGRGGAKGAIVTFDDVTELERKTLELEHTLAMLEKSQVEIRMHNEELQILARRDPLTDVANRRAFMEAYEPLFERTKRDEGEMCCLMADIDHFKRINDAHGHQMGDDVIRRVADAMKTTLRSTDAVCRYGGEEFCIVLAGAPIEAAASVAERLRAQMDSPDFAAVPVTVSLGVASIRMGAQKFTDLLHQADEAMYASKQGGRNCVTRWDQRPKSPRVSTTG